MFAPGYDLGRTTALLGAGRQHDFGSLGQADQRNAIYELAEGVTMSGDDVAESVLVAWCKERLANYKVPKRIIRVDSLPLSPVGKVDKMEVRTIAAEEMGPELAAGARWLRGPLGGSRRGTCNESLLGGERFDGSLEPGGRVDSERACHARSHADRSPDCGGWTDG